LRIRVAVATPWSAIRIVRRTAVVIIILIHVDISRIPGTGGTIVIAAVSALIIGGIRVIQVSVHIQVIVTVLAIDIAACIKCVRAYGSCRCFRIVSNPSCISGFVVNPWVVEGVQTIRVIEVIPVIVAIPWAIEVIVEPVIRTSSHVVVIKIIPAITVSDTQSQKAIIAIIVVIVTAIVITVISLVAFLSFFHIHVSFFFFCRRVVNVIWSLAGFICSSATGCQRNTKGQE